MGACPPNRTPVRSSRLTGPRPSARPPPPATRAPGRLAGEQLAVPARHRPQSPVDGGPQDAVTRRRVVPRVRASSWNAVGAVSSGSPSRSAGPCGEPATAIDILLRPVRPGAASTRARRDRYRRWLRISDGPARFRERTSRTPVVPRRGTAPPRCGLPSRGTASFWEVASTGVQNVAASGATDQAPVRHRVQAVPMPHRRQRPGSAPSARAPATGLPRPTEGWGRNRDGRDSSRGRMTLPGRTGSGVFCSGKNSSSVELNR